MKLMFLLSAFFVVKLEAWALIPNVQWKTMERRSQPIIFVGYCEDVKVYRLFDPYSIEVLFR